MNHSLTPAELVALHRAVVTDPDFAGLPLEALRPLPTTGLASIISGWATADG